MPTTNVHGARGEAVDDGLGLLLIAKARQALDLDRPIGEAVRKVLVVLLRQQRRRHQHRHLPAGAHGDEGGAHGDFGLAEADVAADHAVHGLGFRHVRHDGLDGALLIRGLLELEGAGEGLVVGARVRKSHTSPGLAAGIDVQQLGGDVVGLLRRLALDLVPLIAAQAVQGGVFGCGAGVARDQVQGADRHVELVAPGVFQRQKLGLLAAHPQALQADEAPDAVLLVHHRRAFVQLGEIAHHRFAVAGLMLAPALLAHPLRRRAGSR